MGFLADTAQSAFAKRRKQAYIPEWFTPVSYVLGGLLLLAVVLIGLAQSESETDVVAAGSVVPVAGVPLASAGGTDGPVAVDPVAPVPGGASVAASVPASGGVPAAGVEMVTVSVQGGGSTSLPVAALLVGQKAARGLFTGNFEGVRMATGTVPPMPLATWKSPVVGNVQAVLVFPDGSFSAAFPVDPDDSGPELSRVIDVMVAIEGNEWVFAPI